MRAPSSTCRSNKPVCLPNPLSTWWRNDSSARGFPPPIWPWAIPLNYNRGMGPQRHLSRAVQVGRVTIGGNAPIVVQSMTNTDTADITSTANQCAQLAAAGSELVRITVNTAEAAAAVPHIRNRLDAIGCSVPLIG